MFTLKGAVITQHLIAFWFCSVFIFPKKSYVHKVLLAITANAMKGVQQRRKWSCAFGIKLKVCLMMNEPEQNIAYPFTAVLTLHGKGIWEVFKHCWLLQQESSVWITGFSSLQRKQLTDGLSRCNWIHSPYLSYSPNFALTLNHGSLIQMLLASMLHLNHSSKMVLSHWFWWRMSFHSKGYLVGGKVYWS